MVSKNIDAQFKPIFSVDLRQDIVELPDLSSNLDVRYSVIKPYANIHIHHEADSKDLVYEVEEPNLTDQEKKVFSLVEDGIRELINISFLNVQSPNVVMEYLERNVNIIMREFQVSVSEESFLKIMYFIWRNFVGLNDIEAMINDYYVEDIECNGINTPIYIVHRKYRNLRTNIIFTEMGKLTNFVEKLAQKAGKYISYATPLLDGRLPDGSRLNCTYSSDISTRGPTFTIRRFTQTPWTPIKLMEFRTVSPEVLAYLWILVEYGANIIIIGATASGKTSFLNALAFFIPPAARIVTIEDTKELNLMHENWLPSVSRAGFGSENLLGEKSGAVSMFELLKESFRQRPDYVVVGEIRGSEAFVMFQGAASGHPVISTMHAESVETLIRRLETEPINLSPTLVQSLDAVCVLVQARVGGKVVRRLQEVVEVVSVQADGNAVTNTPLVRDPASDKFFFKTKSVMFDKIVMRHGVKKSVLDYEFNVRSKLLYHLLKSKIFGFKEVQVIINDYYKNPKNVLDRFKI
ncbi:MAG: type II/IV secretion system ATPase subunit [Nanoarchaeota archaeon]